MSRRGGAAQQIGGEKGQPTDADPATTFPGPLISPSKAQPDEAKSVNPDEWEGGVKQAKSSREMSEIEIERGSPVELLRIG